MAKSTRDHRQKMSVRLRPRYRGSGCGGTLRRFPISLSSSRTISWESGERLIHSVPRLLRKTRDVCARGPPLQPYFVVFEKFLTLPLYRRRGDGSGHSGSRFDQVITRRKIKKTKTLPQSAICTAPKKGIYLLMEVFSLPYGMRDHFFRPYSSTLNIRFAEL